MATKDREALSLYRRCHTIKRTRRYSPTTENIAALILPTYKEHIYATLFRQTRGMRTLSPKFRSPTAKPPSTTVKCSHERNVRSLANATLGSTLTGRAMRFAAVRWRSGWVDMVGAG